MIILTEKYDLNPVSICFILLHSYIWLVRSFSQNLLFMTRVSYLAWAEITGKYSILRHLCYYLLSMILSQISSTDIVNFYKIFGQFSAFKNHSYEKSFNCFGHIYEDFWPDLSNHHLADWPVILNIMCHPKKPVWSKKAAGDLSLTALYLISVI